MPISSSDPQGNFRETPNSDQDVTYVWNPTPSYKNKHATFGWVKAMSAITMFFAIIGVLFGISMLETGPLGMGILAAAWSLLMFALIPWVLVKVAQNQRLHFQAVERYLEAQLDLESH